MDEKRPENIKADITYNSGRVETIRGKLKKCGTPYKAFSDKVAEFKAFPTVTSVIEERY